MATYHIFAYSNGEDSPPVAVVELNDDDTAVVDVTAPDPSDEADIQGVIESYMELGAPATEALALAAGTYGRVEKATTTDSESPAEDSSETAPETEAAPAEPTPEEPVAAAAEADAVDEAAPVNADVTELPNGTMAMTQNDGTVVTLLRKDPDQGAVLRHKGEWIPLLDPTVLDDLSFVGVTPDSVDRFDEYEAQGNLVQIGEYDPSVDGPFWPYPVVQTAERDFDEDTGEFSVPGEREPVEPVAASVVLNSADDLEEAISAAAVDPDLRWYVERRVASLGLEVDLPWLRN